MLYQLPISNIFSKGQAQDHHENTNMLFFSPLTSEGFLSFTLFSSLWVLSHQI